MGLYKLLQELKETHKFTFNIEKQKVEDNLYELLQNSETELVYIGTNQFVLDYYENNPNSEWHIRSIIQLGFPFLFFTDCYKMETLDSALNFITRIMLEKETWSIFIFTKQKPEKIILGFNNRDVYAFKYMFDSMINASNYSNPLDLVSHNMPPAICEEFVANKWELEDIIMDIIDSNIIYPKSSAVFEKLYYEFSEVPYENFYIKYLQCLSRYKKSVIKTFGLPNANERIVRLKDTVEYRNPIDEEFEFGFDVQDNDLVFHEFYINYYNQQFIPDIDIYECSEELVADFVISTKNISPYYLWNVLTSDFTIDYCLTHFESVNGDCTPLDIKDNPIFIPNNIDDSYFKRIYESRRLEKFKIQNKIENSGLFDNEAKKIIIKDLDEIKDCFAHGDYKAAIILSGSVLEAFLIDWLSEKDNKNYFEEDFMVFDKYRNRYRRADLIDYINTINELEKPNWIDAADKATTIRKKRNLVHAKLYINDNDISKETCTQVIDYLEYVINTRWK